MTVELFHYTDAAGLLGICGGRPNHSSSASTATLRASNARLMNDASEGTYVRDLMLTELTPHLEAGHERVTAFRDLITGNNTDYMLADEVYLVCLSSASDLLSQWRGYTRYGDAYMLHFSHSGIDDALAATATGSLEECGYPASLGDLEIDPALTAILRGAPESEYRLGRFYGINPDDPSEPSGGYGPADHIPVESTMGAAVPPARALMAVNKHPAFREEQEWRIIVNSSQYDGEVKVRSSARGLIDYREVSLPRTVVSGITVGPGPAQSEAARTAHLLFPEVPVHLSRTPWVGA